MCYWNNQYNRREYQDMVFNSAMNRPHPAEAMLKLMSEGHMTIHPKKD